MINLISRVAHYHERAAECIKLADGALDHTVEAQYRSLAQCYIKLAECEDQLEAQLAEPQKSTQ